MTYGFTDVWKGDYCGAPVCVKVIRATLRTPLVEIEKVCGSCIYQKRTQYTLYQIYRRVIEEGKSGPHPNVLPVIEVSKGMSPLCIMSPWMENGNIAQYTKANPGANRLMLVCARPP